MRARPALEPSRGERGFTLVELLVSMAVLALVGLVMMGGLRFVLRAFAHTDARRAGLEQLTLGLAVLKDQLERAEPLMRKVGNEDFVLFEGEADRLRFANVEPPFLAGPPYVAYEYALAFDAGGTRLELRRAPLDPAALDLDDAVAAGEPRVLLRLARSLRFTYFGSLKPREPPRWHEVWPKGARLPLAVRLAEDENPGWPELVAELRIPQPWYCGIANPASNAGCEEAAGQ